jgi:hypothetical protein
MVKIEIFTFSLAVLTTLARDGTGSSQLRGTEEKPISYGTI